MSAHQGRAQPSSPEVLNGAGIFASGVHVVQTLPTVSFDNTRSHSAYVLDSGASTWRVYPYPKDLIEVKDVIQQPDGTWLLSNEGFYHFELPQPSNTWIFDAKTGTFTHPEAVCGTIKSLPDESWILYQTDSKSPYRLCSTDTGFLSQPLPQAIQAKVCYNWLSPVQVSPDKKWLLFADCFGNFSLYSYEIAADRFISLSSTPNPEDEEIIDVDRWVDNTHAIVYSRTMRKESPRTYTLVD